MAAAKGNKYAAKSKRWEEALLKALARSEGSIDAGLAPIADQVIKAARGGDKDAIRELADRIDGRAAQSIEHSGGIEHLHYSQMSDEQLEYILSEGASEGTKIPQGSEADATSVH